eukprot:3458015-Amphidinium_carterae.1
MPWDGVKSIRATSEFVAPGCPKERKNSLIIVVGAVFRTGISFDGMIVASSDSQTVSRGVKTLLQA